MSTLNMDVIFTVLTVAHLAAPNENSHNNPQAATSPTHPEDSGIPLPTPPPSKQALLQQPPDLKDQMALKRVCRPCKLVGLQSDMYGISPQFSGSIGSQGKSTVFPINSMGGPFCGCPVIRALLFGVRAADYKHPK